MNRPHSLDPKPETSRVIFAYKNFAAAKGISHIGLGVSALHTAATLRRHGFWTDVWPVVSVGELDAKIEQAQALAHQRDQVPVSHVVISAPWIGAVDLYKLLSKYRDIHFVVISHSNVGFLQADTFGVANIKEAVGLQQGNSNFHLAGNCERFVNWANRSLRTQVIWLPNLYDTHTFSDSHKRAWNGNGPLRIGCFGAMRPLKNAMTAAGAALEMAEILKVDVEFYVSSGRPDGGQFIFNALAMMLANNPRTKLVLDPWKPWPQFRKVVGSMDVLIQPSFTESFNMVTADGIAEGVASAVSTAIDWVPRQWIADSDDASDVASVATALLHNHHAPADGQHALRRYVAKGELQWEDYIMHRHDGLVPYST